MDKTIKKHFKNKIVARNYGRDLRKNWNPETLATWSQRITTCLIDTHLFSTTDTLLCYVGARPGELDTRPLITQALRRNIRVLVPLTRPAGIMVWAQLGALDDLVKTNLGLLEPAQKLQHITDNTAGLCVVPGLLFRKDGHRIGFGGGYYDRFLMKHTGPTAGLCPEVCFDHHFPTKPHDQPVDWIITENREYRAAQTTAE